MMLTGQVVQMIEKVPRAVVFSWAIISQHGLQRNIIVHPCSLLKLSTLQLVVAICSSYG